MIEPVERLRKGVLGLELLLSRMRKESPDRPRGLVRLGRSYLDLSNETFLEAQPPADSGRHCELLRESARALKRAERAFSEVVEQHWDGEARAAALLLKASVIGPTEPARAIALCEELSKFQAGDRRAPACRVLTAELLSVETSQRDRAELQLGRISRRDRPIELYFIARHRIAEIAWARGDGRRAAEQLQRALASTGSALQRERIERNLAHIRKNSGKL